MSKHIGWKTEGRLNGFRLDWPYLSLGSNGSVGTVKLTAEAVEQLVDMLADAPSEEAQCDHCENQSEHCIWCKGEAA